MNWRKPAFYLSAVLALAGVFGIGYINIRYYIMDGMTAGAFLKAYWGPLLIVAAWTFLTGATMIWIDEDDPRTRLPS